MHRSKLPLTTWFWAAHLMATHSNGMSAQLEIKRILVGDGIQFRKEVIRDAEGVFA